MERPGLRSIIIQGCRKLGGGGVLHIKVEPSTKVEHGLYVEVNEEFKAPSAAEPEGARWVPGCLSEHWDAILNFSEFAADHLLKLVDN
jgi:hypothetical protein